MNIHGHKLKLQILRDAIKKELQKKKVSINYNKIEKSERKMKNIRKKIKELKNEKKTKK